MFYFIKERSNAQSKVILPKGTRSKILRLLWARSPTVGIPVENNPSSKSLGPDPYEETPSGRSLRSATDGRGGPNPKKEPDTKTPSGINISNDPVSIIVEVNIYFNYCHN